MSPCCFTSVCNSRLKQVHTDDISQLFVREQKTFLFEQARSSSAVVTFRFKAASLTDLLILLISYYHTLL